MFSIEIEAKQLTRLRESVGKAKTKFGRELAAAINAVAKKAKLDIGRHVRETINIKKADSEKPLKMTVKATAEKPQVTVSLRKTPRLGLRHFGAKQDKRGVSFKISKKGGRQRIEGAFQGTRPGVMNTQWKGNVFIRAGKKRLPIHFQRGVSAWGAFTKNDFEPIVRKSIEDNLSKQMERRIKLNILRASGLVKH